MSDVASKSSAPVLPVLPVIREDYCTQVDTDRILHFLWEARPDLIEYFIQHWDAELDFDYLGGYAPVMNYLRKEKQEGLPVPPTRIGMIHLMFELHRRIQKYLGNPIPLPTGRAFSEVIKERGLSLVGLADAAERVKNGFYTNEDLAILTIARLHETRPDILSEISEAIRHRVFGAEAYPGEFLHFLAQSKEQIPTFSPEQREEVLWVVRRKIGAICEVKE